MSEPTSEPPPNHAPTGAGDAARRAIALIDLTDLSDDHSPDGIDALCRRAVMHHTAAVCVWPEFVERCATAVAGTGVRVATVVNFPSGREPLGDVVAMTRTALADGADEIDVVIDHRSFLAGELTAVSAGLEAVREVVDRPAEVKVILETGELGSLEHVTAASELAVAHGADFLKTSTGKTAVGATLDAHEAMLRVIAATDRPVGVKPSGGIRTPDEAAAYLAVADRIMGPDWATPATFRFGASSLLDALLAVLDTATDG